MKSSIEIANTVLAIASENGKTLTPMQLVKLVYIAHGWHLALYDVPLIADKTEAWQYGPVIPEVYIKFKSFGRQPISEKAVINDPFWGEYAPELDESDSKFKFLKEVFRAYGHLSGFQLSNITHATGTPWYEISSGGKETGWERTIPDELIKDHYKKKVRK